jgi:hypothetical protein
MGLVSYLGVYEVAYHPIRGGGKSKDVASLRTKYVNNGEENQRRGRRNTLRPCNIAVRNFPCQTLKISKVSLVVKGS